MHSESRAETIQTSTIISPFASSYLKMVANTATGGSVINYSPRFTLTGMTGTWSPAVAAAINGITAPTDVPTGTTQNAGAAPGAAAAGGTILPYSLQTGLTRFAPMQGVPPTKITAAKSPTPLFPTSAFTVATTYLPLPTIVTTTTASQTFSVSSQVNTVSAMQVSICSYGC